MLVVNLFLPFFLFSIFLRTKKMFISVYRFKMLFALCLNVNIFLRNKEMRTDQITLFTLNANSLL